MDGFSIQESSNLQDIDQLGATSKGSLRFISLYFSLWGFKSVICVPLVDLGFSYIVRTYAPIICVGFFTVVDLYGCFVPFQILLLHVEIRREEYKKLWLLRVLFITIFVFGF